MRKLLVTFLLLSIPCTLDAQWRIAVLSVTASSHGDARDESDPARPELRADAPAALALALTGQRAGWRLDVELHRAAADLTESSSTTAITTRDALRAWGIVVGVGRRVAGQAGTPTLSVLAGAALDRWTFDLDDGSPRWRLSARGALEGEFPVSSAWSAVILGQLTAGPSVFKPEELPEGFVQRMAVRVGVALGIARRW